ncbi:MAG: imidazole glycerol phosphate synthase subunit HisH [Anaerolineae bacterium]
MLTIIDYGMGNLRSVEMAFRRLGIDLVVTSDPDVIRQASAVVLPGVGAFGDAMERLRALGLISALRRAIDEGRPFLGICLGMQLLFESSDEMGDHQGLGVLPGTVRRFPEGLTVPHMGWNQIDQRRPLPLFEGLADHSYAYFVHSYFCEAQDITDVAASTDYGPAFTSIVARERLYGIQFHPEKSQDVGARILRNWLRTAGLPYPAGDGAHA